MPCEHVPSVQSFLHLWCLLWESRAARFCPHLVSCPVSCNNGIVNPCFVHLVRLRDPVYASSLDAALRAIQSAFAASSDSWAVEYQLVSVLAPYTQKNKFMFDILQRQKVTYFEAKLTMLPWLFFGTGLCRALESISGLACYAC